MALALGLVLGVGLLIARMDTNPARAQGAPQVVGQATFKANGLPAGDAHVFVQHRIFPAGFTLKHAHGGPAFAYVIAGSMSITDADGTVATYNAGDFVAEPSGHIHTLTVSAQGLELYSLYVLPDGADATIPAP